MTLTNTKIKNRPGLSVFIGYTDIC